MPIRPMRMPQDLQTMLDVLPRAFQYPENPAWSINIDELENTTDGVRTVRRLWPILRVLRAISPQFRDTFDGVIWEKDNQAVGITNIGRIGFGNSGSWQIVNVGVLPAYRRHGIARKLVEAAIELAKQRKAKRIILDVIDGNDPAYQLYVSLGFKKFDTGFELIYTCSTPPAECPMPIGYAMKALTRANWRPKYELIKRITPPNVQPYFPVEESGNRVGFIERMLAPIFESGTRTKRIGVHTSHGEIVAVANYSARTRPGGVNGLSVTIDPHDSLLAPFLIHSLLNEIMRIAPGRTTEMRAQSWSTSVIEAAKAAGFEQRMAGNRMGLDLDST